MPASSVTMLGEQCPELPEQEHWTAQRMNKVKKTNRVPVFIVRCSPQFRCPPNVRALTCGAQAPSGPTPCSPSTPPQDPSPKNAFRSRDCDTQLEPTVRRVHQVLRFRCLRRCADSRAAATGQRAHGLKQHAELLASATFIPPFRLSVSITTSMVSNEGWLSGLTNNASGVEPQNRFGPSLSSEELLEPHNGFLEGWALKLVGHESSYGERFAVQRCGRRQVGAAILHDVPAATTSVS